MSTPEFYTMALSLDISTHIKRCGHPHEGVAATKRETDRFGNSAGNGS